jgi:hypothetical protein
MFFSFAEILILALQRFHVTQEIALGRFRKIARTDYKLRCVCPSVRMEKLSFQWTDFHEILHLNILFENVSRQLRFN